MKNQALTFVALTTLLSIILLSCQDRDGLPENLKTQEQHGALIKPIDLVVEDPVSDTTKLPPKKDRQHWISGEN